MAFALLALIAIILLLREFPRLNRGGLVLRKENSLRLTQQIIPRIIYRTARGRNDLYKKAWNMTAKRNPEYRQVIYSDDDMEQFMKLHADPAVYNAFLRINPKYGAARADIFRYAVLFSKGGVYLDAKSVAGRLANVIRPDDEMLLSKWPQKYGHGEWLLCAQGTRDACQNGEYQQWWLATRAGHPFLKTVLDDIVKRVSSYTRARYPPGKQSVIRLTGPKVFTLAVDRSIAAMAQGKYRRLRPNGDGVFQYSAGIGWEHMKLYTHYSKLLDEEIVLSKKQQYNN